MVRSFNFQFLPFQSLTGYKYSRYDTNVPNSKSNRCNQCVWGLSHSSSQDALVIKFVNQP